MDPRLEPVVATAGPMPAKAGIGLRAPHHAAIATDQPPVGWFEAHSENYFADGGAQLEHLAKVRERYPLSLHGVGLSNSGAASFPRAIGILMTWIAYVFLAAVLLFYAVA